MSVVYVQLHEDDRVVLTYNNKHEWDGKLQHLRTIIVQDAEGEFYTVLTGEVTPMQLDPEWVKEWQLLWKGDFHTCLDFFSELVEDLEIEESKRHFQFVQEQRARQAEERVRTNVEDAADRSVARKTYE